MANVAGTIDNSEVELFLEDVLESYKYLHARVQESKESFRFSTSAIWLNIDEVKNISSYELRQS